MTDKPEIPVEKVDEEIRAGLEALRGVELGRSVDEADAEYAQVIDASFRRTRTIGLSKAQKPRA